jgi:hypothetical protein
MVGYWRGSVACDVGVNLYLVAANLVMKIHESKRKLPCAVKGVSSAIVASKLPSNYFDDSKRRELRSCSHTAAGCMSELRA